MEEKKFIIGYDYTEDVNQEMVSEVIKMGLGHGTDSTLDIGNKQEAILDYDLLYSQNLIDTDTYSKYKSINITASNYQKVTEEVNKAFSIGVNGKAKKVTFGNTVKVSTNNKMSNTDNYEYGVRILVSKILGANIVADADIKKFILPAAFNAINGNSTDGAIAYPSTPEGFEKLFSKYGTHIITKAIFGTKYEYYFLRETFESTHKMTDQVDYNLGLKYGDDEEGLKSLGVKTGMSNKEEYESCLKNSTNFEVENRQGGANISDVSNWQASCNFNQPYTIALIGYVYPDDAREDGLIPLWDLVSDPVRADKMKKAYDKYVADNTTVFKKDKIVIADVIGKYYKDGNAPTDFLGLDYNNVTRKYFRLETNLFDYVTASKKGKFYMYYALGFASQGGLSEIKFDDKSANYWSKNEKESFWKWKKRGEHANQGVTGVLNDNCIFVKEARKEDYPNEDARLNDMVTGFGIEGNHIKTLFHKAQGNQKWTKSGKKWYAGGLVHKDVFCLVSKDPIE